ncbi:MAG: aminopeptidase P family protein [Spirochaetales bacterium]|jgi:Xaa-Pro aminopeptidase|nr:aminopeptidase P family protein [Spirochaetales bacterium]
MIKNRLKNLRTVMKRKGLAAYIVTGTDPHQSENVCDRWKTRAWISGFTGSAGTVVITSDKAGLWTDSRYFLQAEKQLEGSGYILFKQGLPGVAEYPEWLLGQLSKGSRVGIAAEDVTVSQYRELESTFKAGNIQITATDDLLDKIWEGRPPLPSGSVRQLSLSLTGMKRKQKLHLLREAADKYRADSLLITSLDDIAWILNLRGTDVPYNPVFLSYLCITKDCTYLFCGKALRDDKALTAELQDEIELLPYEDAVEKLTAQFRESRGVYVVPDKLSMMIKQAMPAGVPLIEGENIPGIMKAVKNSTELEGLRRAHREDGAALADFLYWLEQRWDPEREALDEYRFAAKLHSFRAQSSLFLGESFAPIIGFRDHGAIVHYSASSETAYPIRGQGLVIVDSGGQYEGGTTDITRTLLFGDPSERQRRDYTVVLKAHLALARQRFPVGTYGYQLDGAARLMLWNAGLNYGHGTGHGVGHMLNVHEGPQNISPKPIKVSLRPGMVVSNEPGVYRTGEYGIRIENLLSVAKESDTEFGEFYCFENLTLCPYERGLIDVEMLTGEEIEQVDAYHRRVVKELGKLLSKEVLTWLKGKTEPLKPRRG